jgi:hypothetical protein
MLVVEEWEGVATVQQHRSWVLSARVCNAGKHGTHHLHCVGFGCTVELEGADAAVRWWESSVQCGETARCVMCMGEVARGVCRSIPPQSFLMLSRQGTATLRSCFTGIIMQECSSNHQREWGASTGQYTETPHPCSRRAAALHTRLTERSYGRWWCTGTCTSDTSNVRPFSPWTFSSTRRKPLPWWLG